jgi:hypothetical protein
MMVKVGDKVMRRPVTICATDGNNPLSVKVRDMVGVVDYVNEKHGWYRVVFQTPGGPIRECFFDNE